MPSGPQSPAQQYMSASIMQELRGMRGKASPKTAFSNSMTKFVQSPMFIKYQANSNSVHGTIDEPVPVRKDAPHSRRGASEVLTNSQAFVTKDKSTAHL